MSVLGGFLSAFNYFGGNEEDDSVDWLHYVVTSNMLVALGGLVSWKQFGGAPIECLVPNMFSNAWEQYAEQYCWSQYTYFVPMDDAVVADHHRQYLRLSYYQWIPLFLLFMAFCFRVPNVIWNYFSGLSGINVQEIIKVAADPKNVIPATRAKNIKILTDYLQNSLRFHRRLSRRPFMPHTYLRLFNLKYKSFYVATTYMLTKISYLANVIFQIFLVGRFMGSKDGSVLSTLSNILNGTEWETSGVFPRVTLCDFTVRSMGQNVQPYSVQCVLIINILNEKIFVFLWFWTGFLTVVTTLSIIFWMYVLCNQAATVKFISSHLELSDVPFDPKKSCEEVEGFVNSYLRTDGLLALRMVKLHAGVIFTTELIAELWKIQAAIEKTQRQIAKDPIAVSLRNISIANDSDIIHRRKSTHV